MYYIMWNLFISSILVFFFVDSNLSAAAPKNGVKFEKAKQLFRGVLKPDEVERIATRLQKFNHLVKEKAAIFGINENAPTFNGKNVVNSAALKKESNINGLQSSFFEDSEDPALDVLFGGDILLTEEQLDHLIAEVESDGNTREKRQAINVTGFYKIFDKTKPIYYKFDSTFSNAASRDLFREAMEYWNSRTCLNITEGMGQQQINVISGSNCWSNLGNANSPTGQQLSIGEGCARFDTMLHEMGHALGFHHTQNRHDRDHYIRVYPGTSAQYWKESEATNNNFGLPYDLGSIMHYNSRGPPIGPMDAVDETKNWVIGALDKVAFSDFKMMNVLYNCQESCPTGPVCQHQGFRNPKNCNVCVCPRGFQGNDCSVPQFTEHTNETCGGLLSAQSYLQTINGTIDSHSTAFLRNIATCYWHIQAPEGKIVRVRFNSYNGTQPKSFAPCYAFGLEVRIDSFETIGARICTPEMLVPTLEYKAKSNYAIVAAFTKQYAVSFSFSYWYVDQNNCEAKDEL